MPWLNATLADSVSGMVEKANSAIADAEKSLDALTLQTNAMQGKLTAVLNAATANKSMIDKLAESGFYMIVLSPGEGAWNTRLAAAANAPPNGGYCTGTANIIISANPDTVINGFNAIKDAMTRPIDDAKSFIERNDFSDFVPELPDFPDFPVAEAPDWGELFTADEWHAAKLGDVFGGPLKGIATASAELNRGGKAILSSVNHMGKAASALDKGLNSARSFMTALQSTGVYSIMLPPAVGGCIARLQAEAGAPPSNSQMYSAGFVCITVADGAGALAAKYDTITKLMKG